MMGGEFSDLGRGTLVVGQGILWQVVAVCTAAALDGKGCRMGGRDTLSLLSAKGAGGLKSDSTNLEECGNREWGRQKLGTETRFQQDWKIGAQHWAPVRGFV